MQAVKSPANVGTGEAKGEEAPLSQIIQLLNSGVRDFRCGAGKTGSAQHATTTRLRSALSSNVLAANGYSHKLVADSRDRMDILGPLGILAQLLSDAGNVRVDGTGECIGLIAPDGS